MEHVARQSPPFSVCVHGCGFRGQWPMLRNGVNRLQIRSDTCENRRKWLIKIWKLISLVSDDDNTKISSTLNAESIKIRRRFLLSWKGY